MSWQRKPKSYAVVHIVQDEEYGYGPFATWEHAQAFAKTLVGGGKIHIKGNT